MRSGRPIRPTVAKASSLLLFSMAYAYTPHATCMLSPGGGGQLWSGVT
eukprot:COSAG01_NODE_316_length_19004_cov_100.001322_10_plen_48_part_00